MKMHKIFQFLLVLSLYLGIKNGFLALWEDGKRQPIQVYPVQVSTLPTTDQDYLQRGIHINSKAELVSLLEDYLS